MIISNIPFVTIGPCIRLFVDEIKKDTELTDKVITRFMEGNDNLNEN